MNESYLKELIHFLFVGPESLAAKQISQQLRSMVFWGYSEHKKVPEIAASGCAKSTVWRSSSVKVSPVYMIEWHCRFWDNANQIKKKLWFEDPESLLYIWVLEGNRLGFREWEYPKSFTSHSILLELFVASSISTHKPTIFISPAASLNFFSSRRLARSLRFRFRRQGIS